jgi:hypothetical protein
MMLSQRRKGANGFFQPPTWSQIYLMKTMLEKNNLGSWYGWEVEHHSDIPNAALLEGAKPFMKLVKKVWRRLIFLQKTKIQTLKHLPFNGFARIF